MSGGLDAAGDAITAGLVAHAIEPGAGARSAGAGPASCLNCGTALVGEFCHHCGQNGHVHRSLAGIGHDLAHGAFHFEGKIWRTLPMLAFKPGELTRRYVHGERARFVSPLALFLFTVFLMFAVINSFGGHLDAGNVTVADRQGVTREVHKQIDIQQKGIANVERAIERARIQGRATAKLEEDLATRRAMLGNLQQASINMADGEPNIFDGIRVDTGWTRLDKGIVKANANPSLVLYKVQSNAYKFSWALIPISVPFVWLMFLWHRRRHLYDHAIFVTYSLSFMSLLVIVLTALGLAKVPTGLLIGLGVLIAPVHLYAQLKGAYEIGRLGALVRTILLLVFASVALALFLLILLGIGLIG